MKKLILITVFVLLGTLANTAMAAKPRPEPTPETITLAAGPLDRSLSCGVVNNTDAAIVVNMNYCVGLKDNTLESVCYDVVGDSAPPVDLTIDPGHFEVNLFFKYDALSTLTCELTYTGFPGDITGVYCGSTAELASAFCLPLQAR